ncbi:hypothetical protein [Flavobacterium sp.]|uniref:hypothetical protein n=1 Tax=Flavobacterium sp. TaxID=239 RepID=UPI002B4AB2AD|nr:hypothetical protein [Flavobacterium sp.]HLP64730.1 hypothetical protein [Flavobacterium sp.]
MELFIKIKGYFIPIIQCIGNLFKPIYLFMPGLFFLMAYYLIIVFMPIGQDMLMHTTENGWPFIFTNLSLLIWMHFAWLSSRLVADEYQAKLKLKKSKIYHHFPRILAYNVPVGLQIAALNLPTIGFSNNSWWCFFLLFVLHNAFYFLLDYVFFNQLDRKIIKKKAYGFVIAIIILYILFLIYVFTEETQNVEFFEFNYRQHVWVWMLTSIFYFVLQILFVKLTIWKRMLYNNLIDREHKMPVWKNWYNLLSLCTTILYFVIVLSTQFAHLYGSLGCVLLGFGIWLGFVYLIKFLAIRYDVKLGLPLLLLAVLIGLFSDPYDVDLPTTDKPQFNRRPDLDMYLERWVKNKARYQEINQATPENPYPVYLVIADGGASKSGYWVASVLSKMEETTESKDPFSNHLLSIAGASGGSVGNAVFYSLLKEKHIKKHPVNYSLETKNFFKGDFLTYTAARFLGPDLFRHFIPGIPMDDRAAALEEAMEQNPDSPLLGSYFNRTIDSVYDYNGRLPLFFINTTNLDLGISGVISNIKITPYFSNRMDVLQEVDSDVCEKNRFSTIKLSTSVLLGARFPYVSPAGEINGKYFVDGGYFDNSGGGITLELVQYIKERIEESQEDALKATNGPRRWALNQLLQKLQLKVLYISNGVPHNSNERNRLHPLINDVAAPLLTVFGTYGQQTNLSNNKLNIYMNKWYKNRRWNPYQKINLPYTANDTIIPYPMNWVISDYNLKRMENNNLKKVKVEDYLQL